MLSRRVQQIGFSPTLAVNDLARRMRAEGIDILDFSAGQPDFFTPERVKEAGKRAIDENQTRYTAAVGLVELREAIASKVRDELQLDYSPDQIVVSPGAKACLYFAFMALLDPGDEVVVPAPYWTSYPEQVRLAGGEPVFVECSEDHGFKLTGEQLEAATTKRTKALLLNYPSNPTGACYSREELLPLAEVCVERGIWVVADEIYSRLLFDGRRFTSMAQLGPRIRERTVLIDGMSKTYAMTGWRVGYAAGPRELLSAMGKIQSHSTSNATSISQWAGVEALRMTSDELEPRRAEFERRRNEIVEALRRLPGVTCRLPEGAFYAFPNVSGCFTDDAGSGAIKSGQDLARYLLEQARVAVVPGEAFGSPGNVRFSYAASLELVREGMDRVAAALNRLAGR
jgi:aspartate aminotransferase